jgi:hypothetical protein
MVFLSAAIGIKTDETVQDKNGTPPRVYRHICDELKGSHEVIDGTQFLLVRVLSDIGYGGLNTTTTCRMRSGISVSVGRIPLGRPLVLFFNSHTCWKFVTDILLGRMSDELLYNTAHRCGYELPAMLRIDITPDWLRSPIRGSSGLLLSRGISPGKVRDNRSTDDHKDPECPANT